MAEMEKRAWMDGRVELRAGRMAIERSCSEPCRMANYRSTWAAGAR